MSSIVRRFGGFLFQLVHGNNLVYNACWEDPRLDRVAMEIGPQDNIMVITSAGCNALDYALDSPNHVYAVDVNPRQNSLLALKIAGIRALDFETFFRFFGEGKHPDYKEIYRTKLRPELPEYARSYWDSKIRFFSGNRIRRSFYFQGTTGLFARSINVYIDRVARVRRQIDELLAAETVEEQKAIYNNGLKKAFWTGMIRWLMGRDMTLALLGVPKAQRKQIEKTYDGGVVRFIESCLEAVFAELPIKDNYFWRVYLSGRYSKECCPNYLKEDHFKALKGGLIDRVTPFNGTIAQFLHDNDVQISRYVLLDHMDWLSTVHWPVLEHEWQMIVDRATPNARLLWRSGGMESPDVGRIEVNVDGGTKKVKVADLLTYNTELATELHKVDRVHTYGSFYIANMKK